MTDELIMEDAEEVAERTDLRKAADDAANTARDLLATRQAAYSRVFAGNGTKDDVDNLMLDLATFCRGFESTFDPDPRKAAMLDGRREVFLRIMDYTKLPLDALLRKYHGGH